jgi:hypothetical protein
MSSVTSATVTTESNMAAHDPGQLMFRMISGYWVTQIVATAAQIRLADILVSGPKTAEHIADKAGLEEDSTRRLLRACVELGLVECRHENAFGGSDLLATLRDVPGSLRAVAIANAGPSHWLPWARLSEAVRTGQSQVVQALGGTLWDHFNRHSDEAIVFSQAMSGLTTLAAEEIVRLVDVAGVSVVADIGCANGALVFPLLRAHPGLHGVFFDRPGVAAACAVTAAEMGLADRVTTVDGDFLEAVPAANLYLLKHILHNWNDRDCERILSNIARAMQPNGRLVIVEQLLGEDSSPGDAVFMDLNMLVLVAGRERSEADYRRLLVAAGLQLTEIIPTRSPYMLLTAVKT